MIKQWLNLCLALLTAGTFYGQQTAIGSLITSEPTPGPDALSGSYSIVVEGYDWGAGVSKAILILDSQVAQVSPDQFQVMEEKQDREHSSADMFATSGAITISRTQRTVTNAYLSDASGAAVEGPSQYITLELEVAPNVGSPMCYHSDEQHYRWAEPYQLVIDLASGSSIVSGKTEFTRLAISRTPTGVDMTLVALFQMDRFTLGQQTLSYASYSPSNDGQLHPLVVWLHGLGEGGSDPSIALLGSKVTALANREFQESMGGAYLLVPQCPTMWMDDGSGNNTRTGQSCYTDTLMALIQDFAASHPDIDPSRIYIGGCSNGGYMTMELLLKAPGYFAAAFPTCQAYQDSWLSDSDIELLKDTPIWFSHSELDQVCPPEQSTFPTYRRLVEAGGENIRISRFGMLVDQSGRRDETGSPYVYNPHYVWVRVLNNQCSDPATGETLFQWLAKQRLTD